MSGWDVVSLGIVAAAITKGIDLIRTRWDRARLFPKDIWIGIAMAAGLGFSLGAKANLLVDVKWAESVGVVGGRIITGVAIGAAASGWHEVFDLFSGAAKALHSYRTVLESKNRIAPLRSGDEEDLDGVEPDNA